jgi:NADH:ubiquinone oxidoreductase subunit F (NADH-binding)
MSASVDAADTAQRLLAPRPVPEDLDAHLAAFGPRPRVDSIAMIDALEQSGLRGRGGADFPTGVKWRAVREQHTTRGGDAVVVANAAECEPASFKDWFLLTHRPHLVLDGLEHAAEAVGARRVVIFTTRAHSDVEAGLRAAITERRRRDGIETFIEVQVGPNRYVAGEETALISRVSGHLAKPKVVPPRPFQSGIDRLPTLVQNVETLAHAALVARFGASWFRSAGTRRSPGTALLTVSGAVQTPGVVEAACDATVGAIVDRAGGADGEPAAVLLGGYFGRWVAADRLWNQMIDADSLRSVGATLGTGVLVVAPTTTCGISETDRVLTFLAGQSAGQCGPCHVGLPAIADTFHKVATGRARPAALDLLVRWSHDIRGRGACRHPDGAMLFLASALEVFAADLRHHLRHGACRFSGQPSLLPVPATDAGWW